MKRWIGWVVLIVVAAASGLWWGRHFPERHGASPAATPTAHKARGHRGADAAIPVLAAAVTRRDVPVYLSGLGTVRAYKSVAVRAQVSGRLIDVPFKGGDDVTQGTLLAKLDPRTYQAALDQAKAKLAQDQAQLASARSDLARYQKLAPSGYVSGQQLEQQRQSVAGSAALVKADKAAIEADAIQLSYTDIRAPISGRLGIRQVDVGNLVSAGDSAGIVIINQIKPISVAFTLPEQDLASVRAAGANLPVQALDRNNSQPLASGSLTVIDNQIDPSTGTIALKATFSNQDETLWPGQFVNVRLQVKTLTDVPAVPDAAIQRGPDGAYVYVVGADGKVSLHAVTPGVSEGGFTQLLKGPDVGQTVVTSGQYRLKPGMKVKVQAAPASTASVPTPAHAP